MRTLCFVAREAVAIPHSLSIAIADCLNECTHLVRVFLARASFDTRDNIDTPWVKHAKRLIDVFLYTQYAHQPNEERQRQFEKCLAEVHGKRAVLVWMFLTQMWKCALEIGNAGRQIAWWFKHWCNHHNVAPDVLNSLRNEHAGLGADEKEADKRQRLFREKVAQLATDLWEQAGRPVGGPSTFLDVAAAQLTDALKRKTG